MGCGGCWELQPRRRTWRYPIRHVSKKTAWQEYIVVQLTRPLPYPSLAYPGRTQHARWTRLERVYLGEPHSVVDDDHLNGHQPCVYSHARDPVLVLGRALCPGHPVVLGHEDNRLLSSDASLVLVLAPGIYIPPICLRSLAHIFLVLHVYHANGHHASCAQHRLCPLYLYAACAKGTRIHNVRPKTAWSLRIR